MIPTSDSRRPRPRSVPGPRVTIGQHSTAGLKSSNDDSYGVVVPDDALLSTKGIAMAIADGMSSSEAAKEASENCVKSFLEDYYATHPSWAVKRSAGVVLKSINSWLFAQGQRGRGGEHGMVSTFSGLVLKAGVAHICHAGDSRIGLVRDGALEPLTRDHRRRMARGLEQLSRAFGIDQNLEIDYRAESLETGDIVVFTTDGVHEHVPAAELAAIAHAGRDDLDRAARAIVELALTRGSTDNLTCQLVRIDDPGLVDEETRLDALSSLPFPPELAPGMTFEGYEILREISSSKRGQVYLAIDKEAGDQQAGDKQADDKEAGGQAGRGRVVLKTPSINFEDEPAYIEMFSREEWIGRLVASPHVLKVLPTSRPRRHLFTVTEHFDGQTLRQWTHDHPRPDLAVVRDIVEQIAKGLRALHRKDIVHGDLKPENVMIDADSLVKIIDFGSARAAGLDEMDGGHAKTSLLGTVDYTAPEYHLGDPPSSRGDLFALGVMAYEMLTGRLPYGKGFSGPRDIAKRTYVPARNLRDDIPVWMDAALEKAVAKKPSDRTEALSALVEDLRRPNSDLGYDRPRPLIQRNPLAFWQGLALAEFVVILILAWFATH